MRFLCNFALFVILIGAQLTCEQLIEDEEKKLLDSETLLANAEYGIRKHDNIFDKRQNRGIVPNARPRRRQLYCKPLEDKTLSSVKISCRRKVHTDGQICQFYCERGQVRFGPGTTQCIRNYNNITPAKLKTTTNRKGNKIGAPTHQQMSKAQNLMEWTHEEKPRCGRPQKDEHLVLQVFHITAFGPANDKSTYTPKYQFRSVGSQKGICSVSEQPTDGLLSPECFESRLKERCLLFCKHITPSRPVPGTAPPATGPDGTVQNNPEDPTIISFTCESTKRFRGSISCAARFRNKNRYQAYSLPYSNSNAAAYSNSRPITTRYSDPTYNSRNLGKRNQYPNGITTTNPQYSYGYNNQGTQRLPDQLTLPSRQMPRNP